MPKYIDADALRKRMEQIAEESRPVATARPMREDTPSELLRYGTAKAMIEWLDDVPAADVEPKRRWIPVTERLPEDGTYLITWKNCNAQGVCMAYYGYYQDGLHRSSKPDFYRYDNEWGDVKFDDVTHWMPLPDPPKEEEDAEVC